MINNGQTYAEYLVTMKAYQFHPMGYELWFDWMLHHKVITIVSGKGCTMTSVPEETIKRVIEILRWNAFRIYPIIGPVPNSERVLYELEQQASLKETS